MTEDPTQQTDDIEICEIVITAPDADWLAAFLHALVADRLAASGHIIESVRTIYRWDNDIIDTHEARLHIRTRAEYSNAILNRIKALHPYDVPSVVRMATVAVNRDYGKWIINETDPDNRK